MHKIRFILLIAFLSSCTKEIILDLDEHENKLVVNCFFSPEKPLSVHISKSSSIQSVDTIHYFNSANIEIFHKNDLIAQSNQGNKGIYNLTTELFSQQEYRIVVSLDGVQTVSSHDTIPTMVPIISFDTISIDKKYLYCELVFNDVDGLDNYYLLDVNSKNSFTNLDSIKSNFLSILITDFIVENGSYGEIQKRIYFSDKKIQDSEYPLSFILDKEELKLTQSNGVNTIYLNFKSISYDYYRYISAYQQSQQQQMDVFCNIENGYGIFAGYSLSRDSLMFSSEQFPPLSNEHCR